MNSILDSGVCGHTQVVVGTPDSDILLSSGIFPRNNFKFDLLKEI